MKYSLIETFSFDVTNLKGKYLRNSESYKKMHNLMTFIDVDICHRIAPLRMLYSLRITTLTFICKVTHLKC